MGHGFVHHGRHGTHGELLVYDFAKGPLTKRHGALRRSGQKPTTENTERTENFRSTIFATDFLTTETPRKFRSSKPAH